MCCEYEKGKERKKRTNVVYEMSKEVLPTPESPMTITFTSRLIVTMQVTVQKEGGGAGGDAQAHRKKKRQEKQQGSASKVHLFRLDEEKIHGVTWETMLSEAQGTCVCVMAGVVTM